MRELLPSLTAAQLEAMRELAVGEGWAQPEDRAQIECAVLAVDRFHGVGVRLTVMVKLPFPPPMRGTRILGQVELDVVLPPDEAA